MYKTYHRFRNCTRATALIEFALILPILLSFFIGTIEMSRFAIIHLKLDKTASSLAEFVTQGKRANRDDLVSYANIAAPQIMEPFSFSGSVIYSAITTTTSDRDDCRRNSVNCIIWQFTALGNDASAIGTVGSRANIRRFRLRRGQSVIVAEVYYNYEPLLSVTSAVIGSLEPQKLYKLSISAVRQGDLLTLESGSGNGNNGGGNGNGNNGNGNGNGGGNGNGNNGNGNGNGGGNGNGNNGRR